ncbi:vacuolar ATPase assembly integral membrane protein VMA21 homolog [Wyeomyia smithii]|uniref:vacuolar ATPase assembly integral membrane protein VMA21 homolog n=1 Tax=Wyeomyia smithii TaxID=174621 RepID=UPI002467B151|nr:vacuolar ATPase assembly integral membrane protein VMA21 homolog [Wyeomyia smithii]
MSKTKSKAQQLSKNEQRIEYRNFRVVFFYCILIIILPVATFFGSKYFLFDGFLQLTPVTSNIYSAIAAVIALHIALGLYIYRAYFDSSSAPSGTSGGYQRLSSQKQD